MELAYVSNDIYCNRNPIKHQMQCRFGLEVAMVRAGGCHRARWRENFPRCCAKLILEGRFQPQMKRKLTYFKVSVG